MSNKGSRFKTIAIKKGGDVVGSQISDISTSADASVTIANEKKK